MKPKLFPSNKISAAHPNQPFATDPHTVGGVLKGNAGVEYSN